MYPALALQKGSKVLPFLAEDEEYSAQDLFKATQKMLQEKNSKFLQAILANKDVVNENYKIMQLYQPSLSYQRKRLSITFYQTEINFLI